MENIIEEILHLSIFFQHLVINKKVFYGYLQKRTVKIFRKFFFNYKNLFDRKKIKILLLNEFLCNEKEIFSLLNIKTIALKQIFIFSN